MEISENEKILLAKYSQVSLSTIKLWIQGAGKPSIQQILKIHEFFKEKNARHPFMDTLTLVYPDNRATTIYNNLKSILEKEKKHGPKKQTKN